METIRGTLLGMKIAQNNVGLIFVLLAVLSCIAIVVRAQQTATGNANDFTSVEYYEAPNQQQVKTRLSGAEATPQTGGLLVIKQLKLETFAPDGKPQLVIEAPDCVYDTMKGQASSPGAVHLQTGDGKIQVEGKGFLWQQTDQLLTISNRVHSVLETETESKNKS